MSDTQPKRNILLVCPHNGWITWKTARGVFRASERHIITVNDMSTSLLANGFNQLLTAGLNMYHKGDITHLAMLHSDVGPDDFWVDVLMDEMEATEAAMVSAIVAIKDARGVTSCGVGQDDRWNIYRRFTIRELEDLPETFTAEEAGYPGKPLLVNSGCWLADLRQPWWHQTTDGVLDVSFTIRDRILVKDEGYRCEVEPEDWYISRQLHSLGAKVCATKKVAVHHIGAHDYPNFGNWGAWEHDEATRHHWGESHDGNTKTPCPAAEP